MKNKNNVHYPEWTLIDWDENRELNLKCYHKKTRPTLLWAKI